MGTERGEFEQLAEEFLRVLENERNASVHTVRAYRRGDELCRLSE